MPTCAHCGEQWNYGQTLKTLWRMKPTCPYCDQKNFHSAKARKRGMFFSILLVPIFAVAGTLLSTVALVIIFSIYPFIIDTSKVEEPLW